MLLASKNRKGDNGHKTPSDDIKTLKREYGTSIASIQGRRNSARYKKTTRLLRGKMVHSSLLEKKIIRLSYGDDGHTLHRNKDTDLNLERVREILRTLWYNGSVAITAREGDINLMKTFKKYL